MFMSSRSTFLGDLTITSSVFSTLREILFALNQIYSSVSYHGRLAYLGFFTDLLVWKRYVLQSFSQALIDDIMHHFPNQTEFPNYTFLEEQF